MSGQVGTRNDAFAQRAFATLFTSCRVLASMSEPANAFGLEMAELPAGWTPLEAIAIVTCLNEEGETTAVIRTTVGMMSWEMIGLVEVAKHEWLTDDHNRWSDE